jgi:hypothetical protein
MFAPTLPTTTYISRVLPIAPAVATIALDRYVSELTVVTSDTASCLVVLPNGRLLVDTSRIRAFPCSDLHPLREIRAALRSRRRGRVADVYIELLAWSRTRSELGIRLEDRGRIFRSPIRMSRYFDLGHEAVAEVGRGVTAWASIPPTPNKADWVARALGITP